MASGEEKMLVLHEYLSLPQPRTLQKELAKQFLAKQYGIDPSQVGDIDFFANKKFSKFL